jgi:acetolactate synthase small subunit
MAAQGIYILKPIINEKVFDNLCETLEDYGVEIVAPVMFDFETARQSETELVLSGTEEVLEDLKEELEASDLLDTVSIVDSFENQFDEESGEEVYEEDGL